MDNLDKNKIKKSKTILIPLGRPGQWKTTAVNISINALKDLKLEEHMRYFFIKEKENKPAVSQTDRLYLFYLRDFENRTSIKFDIQGYMDKKD